MKSAGASLLEERARSHQTATYEELWHAVDLAVDGEAGNPWRQIPQLLRHIGEDSIKDTGMALGALVVGDGQNPHPSEGFFRLAAREGLILESDSPDPGVEWTGMSNRQRLFWQKQLADLFSHYS